MRYWLLVLLFFLMPLAVAEQNDRMVVDANVLAPVVRVQVLERVSFGSVSPGFVSERVKIVVNNTGTTAVQFIPQLETSDKIFSNLMLARRTTEEFKPIGSFKMNIPRPRAIGQSEDDYFYAQLDLRQYTDSIPQNIPNHHATVVFWATAV